MVTQPPPAPVRRGIPIWVLALVWLAIVAILAVGTFFVVLMLAFSCDSGWRGCSELGGSTTVAYLILGLVCPTIPLVYACFNRGVTDKERSRRVGALVAIVLSPLVVLALCVVYWVVGFKLL